MSPQRRLQNLIAFGQTQAAVLDGGPTPLVQAKFGDLQALDGLQIVQHFGFSSSAPPGTNVVALFGAGSKSKGTILGTVAPASRRKLLLSGEAVVHDLWGNEVHLSQAGVTVRHATNVTIAAPTQVLIQSAGGVRVEGPLTCTGEVTAMCDGAFVTLSRHTQPPNAKPNPGT